MALERFQSCGFMRFDLSLGARWLLSGSNMSGKVSGQQAYLAKSGRDPLAEHSTSAHHKGDMDIHEQAATYTAVNDLMKWCSLALVAGLAWAVLSFCTPAGMFAGLVVAAIIVVLGIVGLGGKKSGGH
jgi:hypothetical protein